MANPWERKWDTPATAPPPAPSAGPAKPWEKQWGGDTKSEPTAAESLGIPKDSWAAVPFDALQGVGAGVLSTARGISKLAHKVIPAIPEIPASYAEPPDSIAGNVGKYGEQAAEFLLPGGIVGKGAKAVEGVTAGMRGARLLNVGARAALEGAGAGAVTLAQTGSPSEAASSGAGSAVLSGGMQAVAPVLRKATPFIKNRLDAVKQAAMDWAENNGVPLSAGQRSGNQMVQRLEHSLENTMGASGRSQQFFRDQEQALTQAGRDVVNRTQPGMSLNPYEAGENMATKVKSVISDAKADADTLYGDLRNEYAKNAQQVVVGVDPQTGQKMYKTFELPVDVSSAKASLKPIYDELMQTMPEAKRQMSPGFQAFSQLINGPDVMDAVTADRNLSALKSIARGGNNQYLNSRSQGLAKWAIGNMEKDFGAALNGADPSLAPKLQAARDAVRKQHTVADILNSLPDEPAALYQRLTTAGDRTYNDLAFLNREAPDQMRQVGRTFLDGLFDKATSEGGFRRAAGVMADWQRLGPQTKRLMFGSQKNISELNNFFLAAKQLTTDSNPSGTGKMLAALGALGVAVDTAQAPGGIEEKAQRLGRDVVVAGTVTQGLSRALLTPGGARMMTQVLKSPVESPQFRQAVNGVVSLMRRKDEQAGPPQEATAPAGNSVTAPDGSVHAFDTPEQAAHFRDLIKQAGQQ